MEDDHIEESSDGTLARGDDHSNYTHKQKNVEVIDAVDELKEPGYSNTTDETENDAEVKELFEHDCPAGGWWSPCLGAPEFVMAFRSISGILLYSSASTNGPYCEVPHAVTHNQAGIGHIASQNSQML